MCNLQNTISFYTTDIYSLMMVTCSPNINLPFIITPVKLCTDGLHFFFHYKPFFLVSAWNHARIHMLGFFPSEWHHTNSKSFQVSAMVCMRYLFFREMMLHHGYLVYDNSGNSSDLKMSGTKPRETAPYPNRTDTLFTKLQKHSGLECHEPSALWHRITLQKNRYPPQEWAWF